MIKTYFQLKAFISQAVKADERISPDGFIWGSSKRAMERLKTLQAHPYFWVSDCRFTGRALDYNLQILTNWELDISIRGNTMQGDELSQEFWLNKTHQIMMDFLGLLSYHHDRGDVFLDWGFFRALPDEGDDIDFSFGWSFSISLGIQADEFCKNQELLPVVTLEPDFVLGGSSLSLLIDAQPFAAAWINDDLQEKREALQQLSQDINQTLSNQMRASHDGFYLYLTSLQGGGEALDLEQGEHNWNKIF